MERAPNSQENAQDKILYCCREIFSLVKKLDPKPANPESVNSNVKFIEEMQKHLDQLKELHHK